MCDEAETHRERERNRGRGKAAKGDHYALLSVVWFHIHCWSKKIERVIIAGSWSNNKG